METRPTGGTPPPRGEDAAEADLVARWRAGDGDALVALCRRYEGLLRDRVRRRLPKGLRRRVSVSDILQEAQMAAFEQRGTFEPQGEGSFGRWMLAVVENRALMAVRRHHGAARRAVGQERTRGRRPDTEHVRARGPTPSQVAIASELADLAREAMLALPPDYREVLRLAREEHLPLVQVGERMGRTREAAKKLYARALSQFAAELRRRRGETRA